MSVCLPGSPAATLQDHIRANILRDVGLSIREFFDDRREEPAPLYARLARERIHPGDVIITFNYEAACERQLKEADLWEISDGYGFLLGLDSLAPSKVKVLKLHGSTNWRGPIFRGSRGVGGASNMLGSRPTIFVQRDLEFLGYPTGTRDPECAGIESAAVEDAMIMPVRHKQFFVPTVFGHEWEDFWEGLWRQAKSALQSCGKVIIIGYGMADVDEKARKLLLEKSNPDATIEIWCGGRSSIIRNEFTTRGFQCAIGLGANRFEEYLNRPGLDLDAAQKLST